MKTCQMQTYYSGSRHIENELVDWSNVELVSEHEDWLAPSINFENSWKNGRTLNYFFYCTILQVNPKSHSCALFQLRWCNFGSIIA